MNNITNYTQLLRLRTIFKRIQQLSWTVSKMEQKYEPDHLNDKQQTQLLEAYYSFTDELKEIHDELLNSKNNGKKKI